MRRLLAAVILVALPIGAAEDLPPGTVRMPLKDYLQLVQKAEDAARRRALPPPKAEERSAAVASEDTTISISADKARFSSTFEVVFEGRPTSPVVLPLTGLAEMVAISPPGDASTRLAQGGLSLVAPDPGRYTVTVTGTAALAPGRGVRTLALAAVVAPVARTRVEMASDLKWKCPGAVVSNEKEADGRRTIELALPQRRSLTLTVSPEADQDESEELMASVTAVTAIRLEADGTARHDILAYDVTRGRIAVHRIEIPATLKVERVATDEGEMPPVVADGRLVIQRQTSLSGNGYVVLSSRLDLNPVALPPVTPSVPVRSRYLVLAAGAPADIVPQPEDRWKRVDLQDLPGNLAEDLDAIEVVAAWRLAGDNTDGLGIEVHRLPEAIPQPAVAASRETTTLLTVDGTLLHRDVLILEHPSTALDVSVPNGATLWSAEVNDVAVRPVEHDGRTLLPLPFAAEAGAVVKVVVVQEHALPPGRSELEVALPAYGIPVLEHRWKVLLPQTSRYCLAGSDLEQATWATTEPTARSDRAQAQDNVIITEPEGRSGLRGTVADEGNQALPGVTVTLTSPQMQGQKTAVTQADGAYRFALLQPGIYKAVFSLPGYQRLEQENIRISFNRTATLPVVLKSAFTEEVVVSGEAPLVDTRSTDIGQDLAVQPPGGARTRARSFGATGAENAHLVKGRPNEFRQEANELRQGLTGGVRPVTVKIPESGKRLTLAGALPPPTVHLTLEVKSPRH
jgi:Carboxypeptidase regulatory-like domain